MSESRLSMIEAIARISEALRKHHEEETANGELFATITTQKQELATRFNELHKDYEETKAAMEAARKEQHSLAEELKKEREDSLYAPPKSDGVFIGFALGERTSAGFKLMTFDDGCVCYWPSFGAAEEKTSEIDGSFVVELRKVVL